MEPRNQNLGPKMEPKIGTRDYKMSPAAAPNFTVWGAQVMTQEWRRYQQFMGIPGRDKDYHMAQTSYPDAPAY